MKYKLNSITEYQEHQCLLFSKFSVYSSLDEYERRNQTNKDKIISDIYNGKKAEFMVYNFLLDKSRKLNSPDINIYDKFLKSYDADLVLSNVNIHVKSHKTNINFPVSWLFQKNDPLIKINSDKDYLALVVLDFNQNYMYLKNINEVEFKEPIKDSLKNTKLCAYELDLLSL
tara:strand:- start:40 stop:555 length:516 start_codon:yes stop_codon:yes gene_type:complete